MKVSFLTTKEFMTMRQFSPMSTKIHYGCRLAADTDVFDFTDKLREIFIPIYEDVVTRFSILYAASLIVEAREGCIDFPDDPLLSGFFKFQEYESQTEFRLTEFEVAFQRDFVTGRIYARPFMDANHYIDVWYSLPEVESYGYWNNSDCPEDVSDEEWEARRQVWDRLFGNDPVSERSLVFTLAEFGTGTRSLRFPRNGLLWFDDDKRRALIEQYMTDDILNINVSVDDLLGKGIVSSD